MAENNLKIVIVDDEESGRETLRNFLTKYCNGVEIVAEANGVASGIGQIVLHKPDLVFLDVQMQDGTGFDLLSGLSERKFQVVFVTSYDQYALQAFRFSAADYLLKPVDPDQLIEAVEKVRSNIEKKEITSKLDVLVSNVNRLEKIALPAMDGIRFVNIEDIVRCESDDNYTMFFMKSGESIVVSKTLKEYELMLNGMRFCRVHKSYLVNLKYVSRYVPGDGGYLILEDGSHVDVSRRKKEALLEMLMK
ncbi:MAG: DNA-binding response regulator [Bacteroidetes bacterium HGW-Bacteroidetes-6]|jgi:two-component system LytT family response regulator|nr:MAG: DNA-binding response regulator [Bacteroidetes bacterium HGW-Bacteroidetes-6]